MKQIKRIKLPMDFTTLSSLRSFILHFSNILKKMTSYVVIFSGNLCLNNAMITYQISQAISLFRSTEVMLKFDFH